MKTKKIFTLLAAMLLSCVSAFAQSSTIDPAKGDVNGHGVVDVADINAIIAIMKDGGGIGEVTKYYFSVGTTEVTASNYTTVNNATTTIPTSTTFSTTKKGYGYIVAPSNKTITVVDNADQAPITFTELTDVSISGHKVYKTAVLTVGGTIKITLSDSSTPTAYYFSVGTTEVTASNYTTANNATTTIPTSFEFSTTTRGYGYILAPSNKTVTIVDADDNAPIPFTEQTDIVISGHKVYKTNGALSVGGTVIIKLS